MRILIAEDNPDNLDMLTRRLTRRGYSVDAVTDGLQAFKAITACPPDLVLMDVSMPVMSGLEAARKIRALENGGSRIPIIALTAHAMASDRERCLKAGCDAHATKPIDFASLLDLINGLMETAA